MMERLLAKIDACPEKMAAHQERIEINVNAWQEGNKLCLQEMGVYLERKEQIPGKITEWHTQKSPRKSLQWKLLEHWWTKRGS
jgi:hypothetical protein